MMWAVLILINELCHRATARKLTGVLAHSNRDHYHLYQHVSVNPCSDRFLRNKTTFYSTRSPFQFLDLSCNASGNGAEQSVRGETFRCSLERLITSVAGLKSELKLLPGGYLSANIMSVCELEPHILFLRSLPPCRVCPTMINWWERREAL
jgi:hypothetical protein